MKSLYEVLDSLNIVYEKHEHPAVFTVQEAQNHYDGIDFGMSKNLFLRNKKGTSYFLIIAETTRKIDLKKVGLFLNDTRLSFASPQRLLEVMGLTPGSVSPFGLINKNAKSVMVLIDKGLLLHKRVGFHPNINTTTLVILSEDFKRFIEWTGNRVEFVDFV